MEIYGGLLKKNLKEKLVRPRIEEYAYDVWCKLVAERKTQLSKTLRK